MSIINTINGIDILIMILGIIFGTRLGISIQKARDFEAESQHKEDFIDFLNGHQIEQQMRRDGWKI